MPMLTKQALLKILLQHFSILISSYILHAPQTLDAFKGLRYWVKARQGKCEPISYIF